MELIYNIFISLEYILTCPFWSLVIADFIVTLAHPNVIILKRQLFLHRQGLQSGHRAQELSYIMVNDQTSLYKGWTCHKDI